MLPTVNRRAFSRNLAIFFSALGATGTAFSFSHEDKEVTHTSEAIHQELTLKANRQRVYEALTGVKKFNEVVKLSAAGMSLGKAPTEISREVGGTFSLFGGHILGRHIELVPGARLVQAWRVVNWDPGTFSIARFELKDEGSGTRIVFDHTGFPEGQGQHLADGWKANYWEPLQKYLA